MEKATFGTGCFWCTEAVFDMVKGVIKVEAGYAGGELPAPTYESICTGSTGYAEVIQVQFDPEIITYRDLLSVFWGSHDPTSLNRQGNDIGTQYRSVIFYHNESQQLIAEESFKEISGSNLFDKQIVTEISPLKNYFPAENYHQKYYQNVGNRNPYCSFVITPKLNKFRNNMMHLLKNK